MGSDAQRQGPSLAEDVDIYEALAESLAPGEWVVLLSRCLRPVQGGEFDAVQVALTPQRLLLASWIPPKGYEIVEFHELEDCHIAAGKERQDGSRLLVVNTRSRPLGLFFDQSQAEEADAIAVAIGFFQPGATPEPIAYEVDTFAFAQELHGLSLMDEEDQDED